MKFPTVVAVLALAGLAAVLTAGTAGSDAGRGASAWAFVDPAGPTLVAERSRGFVAVTSPETGVFCLVPGPGLRLAHKAAVASQEASRSFALGWPLVRFSEDDPNCADDELEVKTFNSDTALTDQVAFTVVVP